MLNIFITEYNHVNLLVTHPLCGQNKCLMNKWVNKPYAFPTFTAISFESSQPNIYLHSTGVLLQLNGSEPLVPVTNIYKKLDYTNEQECIPVGCVPSAIVAVCWLEGGCLLRGGMGGTCFGGVPAPGGGGIPACTETDPPPCGQTDRCKNITFATSLRTVKKHFTTILFWSRLQRGKR